MSPAALALNLDISRTYAGERLRELHDHGYVDRDEKSYYRITQRGSDYLRDPNSP